MTTQSTQWILAFAVAACAVDAALLGTVSHHRLNPRQRKPVIHALAIGVSHCFFAVLGMLLHRAYTGGSGWQADAFAILAAVGVAVVGVRLSRPPEAGGDGLAVCMLVGADAVVLGAFVAFIGTAPLWFFPACFLVPATAFLAPAAASYSVAGSGVDE